jgi:hypothetical protein
VSGANAYANKCSADIIIIVCRSKSAMGTFGQSQVGIDACSTARGALASRVRVACAGAADRDFHPPTTNRHGEILEVAWVKNSGIEQCALNRCNCIASVSKRHSHIQCINNSMDQQSGDESGFAGMGRHVKDNTGTLL